MWERVAREKGTEVSACNWEKIRAGNSPYGTWVEDKKRKVIFQWSDAIKFLILDEVQKAKGTKTQNAAVAFAARRQKIPVLALSATAAISPLDMRALGYILGLHNGNDFYRWIRNHGCRPGNWGGFEFTGSGWHSSFAAKDGKDRVMQKLHKEIFPAKGFRIRVSEVPDFPETQITAELLDISDPEKLDALYAEMQEALARLREKKSQDSDPENPLTRLLRARQQVELLKCPLFVSMAEDALEQDMSVAIFVDFRDTMNEICKKLNTECRVDGLTLLAAREANIERFQRDEERVLVAISSAGGIGVSLHDLNGNHPRLSLISPGFDARILRQVLGRVHRTGAKTKSIQRILFAAKTVEEQIHKSVAVKLNCLDQLNNGDLSLPNLQLSEAA